MKWWINKKDSTFTLCALNASPSQRFLNDLCHETVFNCVMNIDWIRFTDWLRIYKPRGIFHLRNAKRNKAPIWQWTLLFEIQSIGGVDSFYMSTLFNPFIVFAQRIISIPIDILFWQTHVYLIQHEIFLDYLDLLFIHSIE